MKTYVNVQANHLKDGRIVPKVLEWVDGREWKISKVVHCCRAAGDEYEGIRYTVLLGGMEKYIYLDDDGRWYVLSAEGGGA